MAVIPMHVTSVYVIPGRPLQLIQFRGRDAALTRVLVQRGASPPGSYTPAAAHAWVPLPEGEFDKLLDDSPEVSKVYIDENAGQIGPGAFTYDLTP